MDESAEFWSQNQKVLRLIADHGRAVARLVPIEPEGRVFGAFKGRIVIADDFDAPLTPEVLAEFEK